MYLVTPESMREMDRRTIEDVGVPGSVLMDRAARGAVDALLDHFEPEPGARIGILCGTGNNGGDGLAMATMLAHRGFEPRLVVLGARDKLSDDAGLYFDVAQHSVDSIEIAEDDESLAEILANQPLCALWCDALLGTGLDRPVEGRYARAVEFLRTRSEPIMAVDIPSGLDARTGQILGVAAEADLTATFGFAKTGQCLDPARSYCGKIVVVDIEIPDFVRDAVGVDAWGLDEAWLRSHLPQRPRDMHKGGAGRTLHVGGRPETAGAIALSARGALVGGAGLITVCTDRRSQPIIPTSTPEIMARGVFDFDSGTIDEDRFRAALDSADTVVIGPGLGTDEIAHKILGITLDSAPSHLIVDADGLNLLARKDELHTALIQLARKSSVVLTPHPGELARLHSEDVVDILSDPISAALRLADDTGATAVVKTAATVVAHPDGRIAINRTGNQGMATGGMGDALTGLVASAFADFEDPFLASASAVAVHGLAGDFAASHTGHRGLTVRRLLDEVPAVWQALRR